MHEGRPTGSRGRRTLEAPGWVCMVHCGSPSEEETEADGPVLLNGFNRVRASRFFVDRLAEGCLTADRCFT